MSVFGRISGHLIAAHEMAQRHDTTSVWERKMLDAFLMVNGVLLLFVRRVHHRLTLGPGYPHWDGSI